MNCTGCAYLGQTPNSKPLYTWDAAGEHRRCGCLHSRCLGDWRKIAGPRRHRRCQHYRTPDELDALLAEQQDQDTKLLRPFGAVVNDKE